jgi:SAM-dependent methyltransferase
MSHWTDKFFIEKPTLWKHFMDRGWKRSGITIRAILKVLRKNGITRGKFLELGCGNGRISIPIAKRGFQVTGVDIGASYIEDAEKRARRNRVNAQFICGDTRRLKECVHGKYDVVLSVWTSIGYYGKSVDERLFKTVAQLLKRNGLFLIFNTMSQEYLLNNYCIRMFNETDKYLVLHKDNRFDRYQSINREKWVFYEKSGEDLKYVDELELKLRIYSLAEIVEMADSAGLDFVDAYDSLRALTPARPDSVINIVLRKRRVYSRRKKSGK